MKDQEVREQIEHNKLKELESLFSARLLRYYEKLDRADSQDNRINQGAKIKATKECLQDVRRQMTL